MLQVKLKLGDSTSWSFTMIGTKMRVTKTVVLLFASIMSLGAYGQNSDDAIKAIRNLSDQLETALNEGQIDDVVSLFVEDGELIDEQGTVYSGRDEIKQLIVSFGERFAGAQMAITSESVRLIGPIAIEDGVRVTTDTSGATSLVRFMATMVKTSEGWRIASVRDFPDELPVSSGERLRDLDWIIGDWVSEGTDGRVAIRYQWSEDGNFLLGEFVTSREGEVIRAGFKTPKADLLLTKELG